MSGTSVRTLHYYDEIGLLKPSNVKENGYRYYEEKELIILQQILFFRELQFPLEDIRAIIRAPGFRALEALQEHKKLLELKRKKLRGLIQTIDTTINRLKGGETMNGNDLFDSFGDDEMKQYQEEVKQRWGNTDAYKQSLERTKHWTKEDYERIKKEGTVFTKRLADAMGTDVANKEVQDLVAQHHKGIETFYDCSYEMYRKLGELYVSDKRFTAYYDTFRPGLAAWLKEAIDYYCDAHTK